MGQLAFELVPLLAGSVLTNWVKVLTSSSITTITTTTNTTNTTTIWCFNAEMIRTGSMVYLIFVMMNFACQELHYRVSKVNVMCGCVCQDVSKMKLASEPMKLNNWLKE